MSDSEILSDVEQAAEAALIFLRTRKKYTKQPTISLTNGVIRKKCTDFRKWDSGIFFRNILNTKGVNFME